MGIHAGMLGPVGTARRVDGGYRVSGRYQFGSGCAHASFIGAGTVEVDDDGNPRTTESGLPAMRVVLIPRAEVDFRGNWDVLGLTATGSYDYVVDDVFVPEDYTYSLLEHTQERGGPAFRIGLFSITASGHAGFALGVGRRALDEITTLASTRVRMAGFATIGTEQLFQYELAQHDCALPRRARVRLRGGRRRRRRSACRRPARPDPGAPASVRPPRTPHGSRPTPPASPTTGPARRGCGPGSSSGACATCSRGASTSTSTTTRSPGTPPRSWRPPPRPGHRLTAIGTADRPVGSVERREPGRERGQRVEHDVGAAGPQLVGRHRTGRHAHRVRTGGHRGVDVRQGVADVDVRTVLPQGLGLLRTVPPADDVVGGEADVARGSGGRSARTSP